MARPSTPRFFGDAAGPIAEVETRRHPLAFVVYAIVFLLGIVFIFHWYPSNRQQGDLFQGVSPWAVYTWKWMMLVGGLVTMAVIAVNPRPSPHWPDLADLLTLEGIFGIVSAIGMLIYITVVVHLTGFHQALQGMLFYGALIGGHVYRAPQAIKHARALERYAAAAQVAARLLADQGPGHGGD
jgi:ABC-type transport system involved in cytochrome c biogenesis permease subunit